ncbi:enoyl-CoA hydratase/isomerase family protein [Rhodococcus sp. NPDC058639]|uniref:enoyl-CoA hydratase/isomerase family protein n=1 Tax=Rhodococcus sp. NPDC058639 TaxID=3346570 RepID=UPI003659F470
MTAGDSLLVDDRGGVRTLTLNRPARKNALDSGLWDALRNALDEAGQDPEVRVLVVTGAGGAFCSGADLSNPGRAHPLRKMRVLTDIALLLHELPVPTIAKIDGVAVGAGWNLALGCDFVVATPRSTFSQIFSRRGLSLDLGGSWLLPKLVGLQQAKRLALLAETIDAEQAHRLNLVTWVESEDTIDGFVDDLAGRLVAGPPVALSQTKALLNEGVDRTLRESLAGEARAQAVNFATADAPEAFAAFAEKRDARFTGRWAIGGAAAPESVPGVPRVKQQPDTNGREKDA